MEEKDQLLLNRYRILSQIGEGASSVVYAANDVKIGRDVAVKKIRVGSATAPRVLREMRTIATLTHPGIVVMYDFEETPSHYYIIMEYLDGVTLRKVLKEHGKVSVAQATTVAVQVCEALEYAHSQEIVHRDIKPENIMMLKNGQVKLMDFGIAQLISRDDRERKIVGTLGYMSPEQITGRYVDETSDVFSLGIVVYEMLTGNNPLLSGALKETAMRILSSNPLGPSSMVPSVPEALDAVVLKAMAKDPEERFHSAKDFGVALREFQEKGASAEKVLTEITKELPEAKPSAAIAEEAGEISSPTYRYVKKHEIQIRNTLLGVSLSAFAALGLFRLPFYPLVVSLLLLGAIPLISFYIPKIALGLALGAFLPPLFAISFVHGFLALILLGMYYYYFRERDVYAGVAPLFAVLFAMLRLDFLYVILVGLLFQPAITFATGAFGALSAEVLDLATSPKLGFSSAINRFPLYPQINPKDFFGSFKSILQPFFSDYFLIFQAVVWGLAALAVGFPYRNMENKMLARILGVIFGSVVLILGYALSIPLFKMPDSIVNRVIVSLIIPVAIGFGFSFVLEMGKLRRAKSSSHN
jgi:serine/threonine protein kinase